MKNIKQSFGVLFVGMVVWLMTGCAEDSRSRVLKIYNWADYIDEEVLAEFPEWYKEQTGEEVEVVYQVFDMNEVMYTKIVLGKEDFDLVCPTQAVIERMLKRDLLLPLQPTCDTCPDYTQNIAPYIRQQVVKFSTDSLDANMYVVPYMWGISGILYNSALVDSATVSTWGSFWDPANKGKVLMKDSYWDAYNMAVIYGRRNEIAQGAISLYEAANRHNQPDIDLVENQLKALKPNLAGWEADFGKEMMTKGKIWMSYAWSGDAVWAIEEAAEVGVDLRFVVPTEGSNLWFDGWVIPKYARNVKAATYFMNYMCKPEIALRNMDITGYTSAVATTEMLDELSDSTLENTVNLSYLLGPESSPMWLNPVQYPDSSVINRCELIHDFLDKNDQVLEMWSRAKGDSLNAGMAIIIFSLFFAVALWTIYRKLRRLKSPVSRSSKPS